MPTNPTYIFDFDSTIITCESLDELARLALAKSPDKQATLTKLEQITRDGMAGHLAFDESLRRRLELFKATRDDIDALSEYLQAAVTPSLLTHVPWLTQSRDRIYVISGGFEEYIRPVVMLLGLRPEHVYANRFTYDDSTITGYDATRLTGQPGGKAAQIRALGLPWPLVVIGDGYTDYEIKAAGEADTFWAFTEHAQRPEVIAKADRILTSFAEMAFV